MLTSDPLKCQSGSGKVTVFLTKKVLYSLYIISNEFILDLLHERMSLIDYLSYRSIASCLLMCIIVHLLLICTSLLFQQISQRIQNYRKWHCDCFILNV